MTSSHSGNCYCLDPEEVIKLNKSLVGAHHGLIDRGKLEAALSAPLQTFDGIPLLSSPLARAGKLLEALINAHAFVDGNKRTGWVCATAYLEFEHFRLGHVPDWEIVELVESVADTDTKYDHIYIAKWFNDRLDWSA